jgi:hypothetical protein
MFRPRRSRMAGLAATCAISDSFEQVVVLERDGLPESAVTRPGTFQLPTI